MFGFSLLFFSYIITVASDRAVKGTIYLRWWLLNRVIGIFSTDAWILIFALLGILFCYLGMREGEKKRQKNETQEPR